jgi:hypothetical protein
MIEIAHAERRWDFRGRVGQSLQTDNGSANLQIHRHRALLTFAHLELHRIALVQVFDLIPRRETAAVKKDVFTTVVRGDKAKAFLPNDLLDGAGHTFLLSPERSE